MNAPPFAPVPHNLGPCELAPLAPPTAEPLAAALAAGLASIDPWKRLGYGQDALRSYLLRDDPALRRFAICAGGETAGALCVRSPWLRGPYLELLGLLPGFQGRGLGGAALAWFEAQARRTGPNAWVAVSAANGGARRFYARRGFWEIAPLPGLVAAGEDEILLRKRLDDDEASP